MDNPLSVEVKGDQLVISVGIGVLGYAAQECPDWPRDSETGWITASIVDLHSFARSVAAVLQKEYPDGRTLLTDALDAAMLKALEFGDGVVFSPEKNGGAHAH